MLRATCRDLQMDLPISVSEQSLWWMGGTRRRWGAMDLRGTSRLSTQHDGYLLNADIQGQQHEAAAVNAVRKLVQTPWQSLKQQNKRIGNRKKKWKSSVSLQNPQCKLLACNSGSPTSTSVIRAFERVQEGKESWDLPVRKGICLTEGWERHGTPRAKSDSPALGSVHPQQFQTNFPTWPVIRQRKFSPRHHEFSWA